MRHPDDDGHEGFAEPTAEIEERLSTNLLAAYGGAYLEAERLHHRLAEVYARTFKKMLGACQERHDEKLVLGHSLTLGQLVGEAKKVLPDNLHGDLERQADVRKRIAHVYWRDVRKTIATPEGKLAATKDLLDMRRELYRVQSGLEDHEREWVRRYAAATGKRYQEPSKVPWDELGEYRLPETPRPVRADETVTTVWRAPVDEESEAFRFECDDGLMLQLGDNGLAWSYERRKADWRPEPEIQKRLPVKVRARPVCKEEWDYTIDFGDLRLVVTDHGIHAEPVPTRAKAKGRKRDR
jgi:hypothetical protein